MNKLRESLEKGKFVITGEVAPPKGIDVSEILREAEILKNNVVAVNITDNQSSVMRASPLAIAKILIENSIEPVYQITCRDRNRLALQSELLGAGIFGVENVLSLTGDAITQGDHPQAKQVFDIDSVQLLQIASGLNQGYDSVGKKLNRKTNFFLGAVVSPCAEPIEPEIIKMEKKVKAGAKFFQTQAIYDLEKFENFINKVKHLDIYILAGIVILRSAKMAKFMNENVSGIKIPENLIKEMETSDKPLEKGVEIAANLIKKLKNFCHGIHLMPLGKAELVPKILTMAEIK
jgi:5,10-methylenetetrahydrofolate reductase